jgi:hypothetical protein
MFELFPFDVYELQAGREPILLESVMGMFRAKERMNHFAAKRPGRYYVWDTNSRQVLYRVDTSAEAEIGAA